MFFGKASKSITTKDKLEDKILKLFKRRVEKINIISFFYNTPEIFEKIISHVLSQNKRVLYITNEVNSNVALIKALSKSEAKCNYLTCGDPCVLNDKVNISSHNNAIYLHEKFDLVIYDDISCMPVYSKDSIKRLLELLCNNYGTVISYGVEPIFDGEATLYHPINNGGKPLVEPRIINTKINVNEDLPLVVYDYLNWSIFFNKKVIIYVPNVEKVDNIYNYLQNFKDKLTENVFYYKQEDKNRAQLKKFTSKNKGILITDCFQQEDIDITSVCIMVFFADDEIFDYKKLIYLTGRASKSKSLNREEVIFLSNETSEDIDKAKDILRELNKKAWEEGFLNI